MVGTLRLGYFTYRFFVPTCSNGRSESPVSFGQVRSLVMESPFLAWLSGPQGVSPMHPPLVINRRNEHFPIGIPAMFD